MVGKNSPCWLEKRRVRKGLMSSISSQGSTAGLHLCQDALCWGCLCLSSGSGGQPMPKLCLAWLLWLA